MQCIMLMFTEFKCGLLQVNMDYLTIFFWYLFIQMWIMCILCIMSNVPKRNVNFGKQMGERDRCLISATLCLQNALNLRMI